MKQFIVLFLILSSIICIERTHTPNIQSVDQVLHMAKGNRALHKRRMIRFSNVKNSERQVQQPQLVEAQEQVEEKKPFTPMTSIEIQLKLRDYSVNRDEIFESQAVLISHFERYQQTVEELQDAPQDDNEVQNEIIDRAIHFHNKLIQENSQVQVQLLNLEAAIDLLNYVNFKHIEQPDEEFKVLIEALDVLKVEVNKKIEQSGVFRSILTAENKKLWELKDALMELEKVNSSLILTDIQAQAELDFWSNHQDSEKYKELTDENKQDTKRQIDQDLESAQKNYDNSLTEFVKQMQLNLREVQQWGIPEPGVIAKASKQAQEEYLKAVLVRAEQEDEEQEEKEQSESENNEQNDEEEENNEQNDEEQEENNEDKPEDNSVHVIYPPISSLAQDGHEHETNMGHNQFFNDDHNNEHLYKTDDKKDKNVVEQAQLNDGDFENENFDEDDFDDEDWMKKPEKEEQDQLPEKENQNDEDDYYKVHDSRAKNQQNQSEDEDFDFDAEHDDEEQNTIKNLSAKPKRNHHQREELNRDIVVHQQVKRRRHKITNKALQKYVKKVKNLGKRLSKLIRSLDN